MSHTTRRFRTASDLGAVGLPVWSGVAIVVAALATGMLISLLSQEMGALYLTCFAVAAVVVALFTQPRGLFLTVATMPLSFVVFTLATAWLIGRQLSPNVSGTSTTAIITMIYPVFQFFPVLALVVAGAALIAWLRLHLLHRNLARSQRQRQATRRRDAEADRRNRTTATRARRRAGAGAGEERAATATAATAAPGEGVRGDEATAAGATTSSRLPRPERTDVPGRTERTGRPTRRRTPDAEAEEPRGERRSHKGRRDRRERTSDRARRRSQQVTVQELIRRNEARRQRRESLNRDLYED
ncbi:DUF6542 domain-containing protein [Corynebacterium frankenforstense]